jgi:F-type H+-transporting ATPase subunit a
MRLIVSLSHDELEKIESTPSSEGSDNQSNSDASDQPQGDGDQVHGANDAHDHSAHSDSATAHADHDYLDPHELFHHVQDDTSFHVPHFLGTRWEIPDILGTKGVPLISTASGKPVIEGRLTKFMVLELVGAVLVAVLFIALAKRIRNGEQPRGRFFNLLEVFVVFIRDQIARPGIGGKEADRYVPFLLTIFFFILSINLLGMVPWLGGATGALSVTAALALCVFVVVLGTGTKKMGVVGFLKAQVPHMELSKPMALIMIPGIWLLEMFGLLVKHFVLAVRLFANVFAGHLVLAVFLAFIGATSGTLLYYFVVPAVVVGSVLFSLLELFVAFLQAYIFTFLTSLFIGAAVHPH